MSEQELNHFESGIIEANEFNTHDKEERMSTRDLELVTHEETGLNPVQGEAEEIGFAFETADNPYESWTNKVLTAELKKRNEAIGLDALNVSGTKTELVERLRKNDAINSPAALAQVAKSRDEYREVELSKVLRNPLNPRSRLDYEDERLRQMIAASGGLTKDPVVRENGEGAYYVIAGNRSVENLRFVVENVWGMNPDTFKISVKVKHYDGTPDEIARQEMHDLEADNEGALQFGPLEKLRMVNKRIEMGAIRAAIARDMGVTSGYITQLTNLNRLPERILFLVDVEAKREHFSRFPVERLTEEGIPWRMAESASGEGMVVEAFGIPYTIAQTLAQLSPREKEYASQAAFTKAKGEFDEFILRDDVLKVAMSRSVKQFKDFFESEGVKAGIIDPPNNKVAEAKPEPAAAETVADAEGSAKGVATESPDAYTEVGELAGDNDSWSEMADKIQDGAVTLAPDFTEKLAGHLRMSNTAARKAVEWMMAVGLMVEE